MGVNRGISIGVVGITSTGKSYLLDSAAKVGKTAVAVCPTSERDSYEHCQDVTVFLDTSWLPRFNKFNASGWLEYLKWFAAQIADESVQIIGSDTMSELAELAWHEALKMYQTEDPSSLGKNWGAPWQVFTGLITERMNMVDIAVARGKIVLDLWHGEMREQEGVGEALVTVKSKQGKLDREINWSETMMPRIRGSVRQAIPQRYSLWLFASMIPGMSDKVAPKRFVSDGVDQVKVGRSRTAVQLKGGPRFENDLGTLLRAAGILTDETERDR